MEKDIPLKIELFSSGDDDKHRITSAKEIEFVLNCIARNGVRVALYYDDGNEFILTTLLDVDSKGLWLEQSRSGNLRITESNQLVFVSSHLQAKVQFTASQASSVEHRGYPALYLPMPSSIYRLQRREFFRHVVPVNKPLYCVIVMGKPPKKKRCELTILDISGGGLALICTETDTELAPGESYQDCQIDLPGIGVISVAIVVKSLILVALAPGHMHKRTGCEFHNLDGQVIILLQRYVTSMQRAKGNS